MVENLSRKIDGRVGIKPWEALYFSGLSRDKAAAQKTAANKLCMGTFPFPVATVAGQRVVLVSAMLEVLDNAQQAPVIQALATPTVKPDVPPQKRSRGRPRKQVEASGVQK